MPQLNPAPWFFILALSWVTMLTIFKTKIFHTMPTNTPSTTELLTPHTAPWSWPWA